MTAGSGTRRVVASRNWSEAEAQAVLAELEDSGLGVLAFCRRAGIGRERLRYWKRRLSGGKSPSTKSLLVPVRVIGTRSTVDSQAIEIEVRGERTIRVGAGFDRELLLQVLEVLEC